MQLAHHVSEVGAGSGGHAGGPPRPGAGEDPRRPAEPADRLEKHPYNSTLGPPPPEVQVLACRCDTRACPHCGPRLGVQSRAVLEGRAHLFSKPALLTFTVKDHGEGPEAAYERVVSGSYLARLMRIVGIKNWVWVLEFHKGQAENGYAHRDWPHWHLLADLSVFPGGRLPNAVMKRIWRLWRDKWGLGLWDAQVGEGRSPESAIRYITKYMMKPGRVPEWFWKGTRRRMCQGSRSVGALRFRVVRPVEPLSQEPPKPPKKRGFSRPLLDRVAECGSVVLVRESFAGEDGELRGRVVASIPIAWVLLVAHLAGRESGDPLRAVGLQAVRESKAFPSGKVSEWIRLCAPFRDGQAWAGRLGGVCSELGLVAKTLEHIATQRAALLAA